MSITVHAANHYEHLIHQGKSDQDAAAHTRQRFGLSADSLVRVLAIRKAENYLDGTTFYEYDDAADLASALRELYDALVPEADRKTRPS